jgi:AraC family transcriptional regulator of arabinose operon
VTRKRFQYTTSTPVCFLGRHPKDTRDLFVMSCGYDHCSPEYRVDRQNHAVFVLEYVLRGEGEFVAAGRKWRLLGGMMFHYGPGVPHSYWTHPVNCLQKAWIVYSGTGALRATVDSLGAPSGAFRLENPEQTFTLVDAMCTEIVNKAFNTQEICDSLLRALLGTVAQTRLQDTAGGADPIQTYHRCKSIIDTDFVAMRSPFEACSKAHVSQSYLCRLFKRFAARSPAAYLNELKLNNAAYTLVSSPLSIKEIAASLGFSDQYNFSRSFRRFFGVSPSTYRQSSLLPVHQAASHTR